MCQTCLCNHNDFFCSGHAMHENDRRGIQQQQNTKLMKWRIQSGREARCGQKTGSQYLLFKPDSKSNTYLDDPLSVLPGVVVLCILAENVRNELQFLGGVIQPLYHHTSVMPGRKEWNTFVPCFFITVKDFPAPTLPLLFNPCRQREIWSEMNLPALTRLDSFLVAPQWWL